ncbi:unnamed protein product [Arabidopsis halleri]
MNNAHTKSWLYRLRSRNIFDHRLSNPISVSSIFISKLVDMPTPTPEQHNLLRWEKDTKFWICVLRMFPS